MTKIILIDDSPDTTEYISELLSEIKGVRVMAFASGKEALRYFDEMGADCVLLDYRLDGEDGMDVLSALRTRSASLPVVMFTGYGSDRLNVSALNAGATKYLPKRGITSESLRTAIDGALLWGRMTHWTGKRAST